MEGVEGFCRLTRQESRASLRPTGSLVCARGAAGHSGLSVAPAGREGPAGSCTGKERLHGDQPALPESVRLPRAWLVPRDLKWPTHGRAVIHPIHRGHLMRQRESA